MYMALMCCLMSAVKEAAHMEAAVSVRSFVRWSPCEERWRRWDQSRRERWARGPAPTLQAHVPLNTSGIHEAYIDILKDGTSNVRWSVRVWSHWSNNSVQGSCRDSKTALWQNTVDVGKTKIVDFRQRKENFINLRWSIEQCFDMSLHVFMYSCLL